MKAIILAAGRGTRMGTLTQDTHKCLLVVGGKSIIEYTLNSLPQKIDEVLVVVNYLGDKIKKFLENKSDRHKIRFIFQNGLNGTAGALWQVKPFLKSGEGFMVLNGDDIYDRQELGACIERGVSVGLARCLPPSDKFFTIDLDGAGNITGYRHPLENESRAGIVVATGAYVLDERFFNYQPVAIAGGEYGLPQTIFKMAGDLKVAGCFMKNWLLINTPEDIKKAEEKLKNGGVA